MSLYGLMHNFFLLRNSVVGETVLGAQRLNCPVHSHPSCTCEAVTPQGLTGTRCLLSGGMWTDLQLVLGLVLIKCFYRDTHLCQDVICPL